MIFGHAPVIFPSVLGISIPYGPVFYVHVALLHTSLAFRVIGDLNLFDSLRRWGAWGNAAAILLFLVATVFRVLRSGRENTNQPGSVAPKLDLRASASAGSEPEVSGKEVPDLEFRSSE